MKIAPIQTESQHRAALHEIERLWGARPGSPEGDKLDVLATLVESYEGSRLPIVPGDPVDMIQFAIADMGRSQAELGRLIGRSRASEVLKRRRHLTLDMIRKISAEWRLPIETLVQPYELAGDAPRRKDVA